jgi:hypothetical protein
MPDAVDLQFASRAYVESISRVHEGARQLIGCAVDSARREIELALEDYTELLKEKPVGLCAREYRDQQNVDEVSIFLEYDDVRMHLIRKNRALANLKYRYVTSKAQN